MQITFYRSFLCPRCHAAGKRLKHLLGSFPNVSLREVDIMQHPIKTWKDGVRMIPAIKIGECQISGIVLSSEKISSFLQNEIKQTNK